MGMTQSTLLAPEVQQELVQRTVMIPRYVDRELDTYSRFKKHYPDKENQ